MSRDNTAAPSADWAALKALFHQGWAGGEPVQRRILALCRPNQAACLQRMWRDCDQAETPTTSPADQAPLLSEAQAARFELLEPLGRGGMGCVYAAWQREPIRRKVALKFLAADLVKGEERRRFKVEAETTATLNHAAIIKVFDAVLHETQRPFLVMEHVVGRPLHTYLHEQQPSRATKLAFYRDIARGLAYAHRRGVVHRDIKPANVLVCLEDQRPCVKIIDFGIAALRPRVVLEPGDLTVGAASRCCGTPGYMSPEQTTGAAVDGRADIFSLGLLIIEGLNGSQARVARLWELHHQGVYPALFRLPPRVRDRGDWRRGLRPAEVAVLEKATAGAPDARYHDADTFARDLQALRKSRVVSLHAHSPWRRATALLRRRPLWSLLVLLVAMLLPVGLHKNADVARRLARVQAESAAKELGLQRLSSQSQLLIALVNPSHQKASPDVLAHLQRVGRNLELAAPAGEAQVLLHLELGTAFAYYRELTPARVQFEKARRALTTLPDGLVQERIFVDGALAFLAAKTGAPAEADALYRQSLKTARARLGQRHVLSLALAGGYAMVQAERGRVHEAAGLYREVLRVQQQTLAPDDGLLTATRSNFATLLARLRRYSEAEVLLTANLVVLRDQVGVAHPLTLRAEHNYLYLLYHQGHVDDALAGLQALLAQRRQALGVHHPDVAVTAANVIGLLTMTRRYAEAVEVGETLLAEAPSALTDDLRQNLAHAYMQIGRFPRAEALLRELAEDAGPLADAAAFTRWEIQYAEGCREQALIGMRSLLVALEQAGQGGRADVRTMQQTFAALSRRPSSAPL